MREMPRENDFSVDKAANFEPYRVINETLTILSSIYGFTK